MSSISVGELKVILDQYPDDAEVLMKLRHKYPISKEEGMHGWYAYINGAGYDEDAKELHLMN